ncbi:MAG: hypothetical protein AMXMBFR34_27650 [Myxococcaceae bacterium]
MGLAGTTRAPFYARGYWVNATAFGNIGIINDVRPTLRSAGSHWAAYGGGSWLSEEWGTTTATGCVFGANVVTAKIGCSSFGGCQAAADNTLCLGSSLITFYRAPSGNPEFRTWILSPPVLGAGPNLTSLSEVAIHEFAHDFLLGSGTDGLGHIGNPPTTSYCTMAVTDHEDSSRIFERGVPSLGLRDDPSMGVSVLRALFRVWEGLRV